MSERILDGLTGRKRRLDGLFDGHATEALGNLSRVLRDLTAEARADRLEAVCCRDDEIARVIDILLRQTKNNAALVGPAGVVELKEGVIRAERHVHMNLDHARPAGPHIEFRPGIARPDPHIPGVVVDLRPHGRPLRTRRRRDSRTGRPAPCGHRPDRPARRSVPVVWRDLA